MASKKLTATDIENLIERVDYIPHNTLTFCVLTLTNGATVTGASNVIDPANYDAQVGREMAYRDAFGKIWQLEGYAVKREVTEEKMQHAARAGVASEMEDALKALADLGQADDCADAMTYAFNSMRALDEGDEDGPDEGFGGEQCCAEPCAKGVVTKLMKKAADTHSPEEALRWTQAAEHAAHALEMLDRTDPDW